jgi:putative phosphoesterase
VALEAVLKDAGSVDMTIHAGDIVGYNPWPMEALDQIRDLSVISVKGNHDRDSASGKPEGYNVYAKASCLWTHEQLTYEARDYLSSLPEKIKLNIDGLNFFVCHGSPRSLIDEYIYPPPITPRNVLLTFLDETASDIIIMGHTHIPFVETFAGRRIINPGGVGQPRDNVPLASYTILEIEDEKVDVKHRRIVYDIDKVAREIRRRGLPTFLAQRLFCGV